MRAIITVIAVNIATILLVSMVSYHYWPEYLDGSATNSDDASASLSELPTANPSLPAAVAKPTQINRALTFGGYPCGDDCSQEVAGYRWAGEHGITDPSNCDGRTAPFIEGCRVYTEERRAKLQTE